MQAFVAFAQAEYGRLDVIVNNAGVMPLSPLAALKIDEWNAMIDVNLRGVLHGIAVMLIVGGVVLLFAGARQDEAGHREREAEQRPQRHQRIIGERRGLLRQSIVKDSVPSRGEYAPGSLQAPTPSALRERFRRPTGGEEAGAAWIAR